MHGPGAKELPDVGPSGEPYELGNNRAAESIEQSRNERGRELMWNTKKRRGVTEAVCESMRSPGLRPIC